MRQSKRPSEPSPFVGSHHARYHREDVPYHVISRTFQGTFLLRPDAELTPLIGGVIGKAQELCPEVKLYAYAFMSNHAHLMVSGPPDRIPEFIAFIKREISRRWAPRIGWRDSMWTEYASTALPTDESQLTCLRYILSQGVKEDLVERPEQWPGLHCAKQLLTGDMPTTRWLDATAYGYARRLKANRERQVDPAPFVSSPTLRLDPIPAWAHLGAAEQAGAARKLCDEIVEENRVRRGSKRVLGVRRILAMSTRQKSPCPRPSWFQERRRMVCWASKTDPVTRAYLEGYRAFQAAFRTASRRYLSGDRGVAFPAGAFVPTFCAIRQRSGPEAALVTGSA